MCQKCAQEAYFEHFEALGQTCAKSYPGRLNLSILGLGPEMCQKCSQEVYFEHFEALG